ncbi:MAG: hypothetical protein ACFB4I_12185 [Cyanophyceae cyanobacterium]
MANQSLKSTSTDFEKAAMNRFRSLTNCLPQACRVFREPWGCSTVLCLNFEACPHSIATTQKQIATLLAVAQQLGLGSSVIFKIGQKVQGWSSAA